MQCIPRRDTLYWDYTALGPLKSLKWDYTALARPEFAQLNAVHCQKTSSCTA
jgi:hypothetical protein